MLALGMGRVLAGCALLGIIGGIIGLASTILAWMGTHRSLNWCDRHHLRRSAAFTPHVVPLDNWIKDPR